MEQWREEGYFERRKSCEQGKIGRRKENVVKEKLKDGIAGLGGCGNRRIIRERDGRCPRHRRRKRDTIIDIGEELK